MLPAFSVARPSRVDDALPMLSDDVLPYCGGTELLLAMRMGLLAPEILVDLKGIAELRAIERQDGVLAIGGAATHAAVIASGLVREALPYLVDVEQSVGNPRVRAQGSVGGNLCFAEPKSDVITALIALRSRVVLRSATSSRVLPVEEFIQGPYTADHEPGELLTRIEVPIVPGRRGVYLKYQTMERPTVAVAVLAAGEGIRIVVGAAGELPVWADATSVAGVDIDELVARIEPVPDLTGSEDYKRHVAGVYIRRALTRFEEVA